MVSVTALERGASVQDVAQAVMFLASEEAAFLTGIDLPVDGGFTELSVYRTVWRRATGREG
jgi:NAD(P)-dependent dehydrogenase (short-subunit alcohol dehydrogenase family)